MMKFYWKDDVENGSYECLLYDGDEKINDIYFKDYSNYFNQTFDKKHGFTRPYAYEVSWCHGWSMRKGFDYDEQYDEHYEEQDGSIIRIGGYQGNCTHTVQDIKRWCETWLAKKYIDNYKQIVENFEKAKERAKWFENNGYGNFIDFD